MRKIIYFSLIFFVFNYNTNGCNCDTIYVVLKKRTNLLENWWGPNTGGFINCNTIIEYSNRHRQTIYNKYKGTKCYPLGVYYIIYDIKGRIMGEGKYTENFQGNFILYHKNGRKKLIGYYDLDGGRAKEWIYYNRRGKINKKMKYPDKG